jgi:transposase
MGSTRRRFTADYKKQAVEFIIDGDRSIAEVARNIGVSETSLGKWVNKERAERRERQDPDAPLTESERAIFMRLQVESKENKAIIADLQMQVEFAKKVASWFAKSQQ